MIVSDLPGNAISGTASPIFNWALAITEFNKMETIKIYLFIYNNSFFETVKV
jgi:hypothetical protein